MLSQAARVRFTNTRVLRSPSSCHQTSPHALKASLQVFDSGPAPLLSPSNGHCISLTTQCSLDRWRRFEQQAESWGGPVSVTVYIPAPQETAAAEYCLDFLYQLSAQYAAQHPNQRLQVSALFAGHYAREGASVLQTAGLLPCASSATATAAPGTHPSIAASTATPTIPYNQLYPINALRNVALQHASTPLVLPVDADFIFSQGLEQQLHAPHPPYCTISSTAQTMPGSTVPGSTSLAPDEAAAGTDLTLVQQLLHNQQQQQQHRQQQNRPVMLVLPAFEVVPRQQQQQLVPDSQRLAVPRTKAELLRALQEGSVKQFDCGVFAPKQQPLDIAAWCAATEPFEVQYVDLFEVHGSVSVKQQLPPYSEAFRGYGLNKQQHAWHAAALGFRFLVLPDAFMVTARHQRSSSWRPTPDTAADSAHLERIAAVYAQFKHQLAQQGLAPYRP